MKFIRFIDIYDLTHYGCDFDGTTAIVIEGDILGHFNITQDRVHVQTLLPPIIPPAILCIGLNYKNHAQELDMPLPDYPALFMKNPATLTGPMSDICIPLSCKNPSQVDYEAELAVVIKHKVKNASEQTALESVLGYTCANDVSAREWQKNAGGGQWIRAKSFDTFCPLGPAIVTLDEIPDPGNLAVECRLNGTVMQSGSTSDMIFSIPEIIAYLSEDTTLLPGTVILTGTPAGVGFIRTPPVYLKNGDELETQISSLGTMKNPVKEVSHNG